MQLKHAAGHGQKVSFPITKSAAWNGGMATAREQVKACENVRGNGKITRRRCKMRALTAWEKIGERVRKCELSMA